MIRKCHNHKLQRNPWHREKEPHINHIHQKDRLSKVTSSLFPIKMIAKLEWTWSNVQQNTEQLQTPTMGVTINNKSTTRNHCLRTDSSVSHRGDLNAFYWYQIFALDSAVVEYKVRKRVKIRNRYNQAPHLTRIPMGKLQRHKKTSQTQQLTTRHQQTDVHESITKQDRNNINDPQKKHRLGMVSKNISQEGLNRFKCTLTPPLVQMWIKTHRYLVCMKYPKLINASSPRTYKSRYKKEIKQR